MTDAAERIAEKWFAPDYAEHELFKLHSSGERARKEYAEMRKLTKESESELATIIRAELAPVRAAAFDEAIRIVRDRLAILERQTAGSIGLARAACGGRDGAINEIVVALTAARDGESR